MKGLSFQGTLIETVKNLLNHLPFSEHLDKFFAL